ncbi:MAG: alanine racemase [Candidatus Babeliales bacterium]|nr:alanine racemase [Candidatus Babeliales bacterium]
MNLTNNISQNTSTLLMLKSNPKSRTWVEIDKSAILHNVAQFKSIIGPNKHLAVVAKSNAYGCGLVQIAQILQESADVSWLCIFSLSEGLIARENGFAKPILVLGHADLDLEYAVLYSIDLVAYDLQEICRLNEVAKKLNQIAYIHIKVDTGLSRLGVLWHQALELIKEVSLLQNIKIRGIFSHFAESDTDDQMFTKRQLKRFSDLIADLKKEGIEIPFIHCSNTTGVIRYNSCHFNMVRSGGGTYGLYKSPKVDDLGEKKYLINLKLAVSWKTKVIQIKELPIGSYVSYSRTFVAFRPTITAIIPIGYWDGYSRGLSNKGFVYIKGIKAPIIGRVCMNMVIIDITDLPNVCVGDEVTLIGSQPGVTPDDIAHLSQTINYEVTTKINATIERIVI